MKKTATTRYDVAEHLRNPEEMAAYLEACLEEADGDAAFIAKELGDIAVNGNINSLRSGKGKFPVKQEGGFRCFGGSIV